MVIYDDNKRTIGRASGGTESEILSQNSVTIFPEDKVTRELILNPVADAGAGEKIVIKRAPVFQVVVDEKVITVRSWKKTVREVLKGRVQLGPKDLVEPGLSVFATPGEIIVTRINIAEIEETEPVEYRVVEESDYFVPRGVSKVVRAGANGKKAKTYRVRYKNGVEESRVLIAEEQTKAPVSQLVKKGLMPSGELDFNRTYWNWMVAAGQKYQISPLDLYSVASCESHLRAGALNGAGYYGMYQYSLGFWKTASAAAGFSGASWRDARAQIYTTAKWAAANGWGRWGCKP